MNLRYYRNQSTFIAKLADQAHEEMSVRYAERMKTEYPGDVIFYDMFNQRFAELIVQECIDTVQQRYMGDNNHEDAEVRRCVEDLKRHFGVEQ